MFVYKLTSKAFKQMQKLDMSIRKKVFEKIDYFVSFPDPLEFSEPIKDPSLGEYRFKIGDYRVIFDVVGNILKILKVGHRRDIYK